MREIDQTRGLDFLIVVSMPSFCTYKMQLWVIDDNSRGGLHSLQQIPKGKQKSHEKKL